MPVVAGEPIGHYLLRGLGEVVLGLLTERFEMAEEAGSFGCCTWKTVGVGLLVLGVKVGGGVLT